MQKLEERFKLGMNDYDCIAYVKQLIFDAHNKWTTNVYDQIQYMQNKIIFWEMRNI